MNRRNRVGTTAIAVLSSAGLLAGCAAGAVATPGAPPVPPTIAVDLGNHNPGNAAVALPPGSIDAALDQLPALAGSIRARSGVPGLAVAVVHGGRRVYAGGFGDRVVSRDDLPVDPATVFQVASVSKPIAATVVATQVSKKVVSWDTPVHRELRGFRLADPWVTRHATVGDFFAHRTGLPRAAGDLLEDVGYGRRYILEHLRDEPLAPFRSTYGYANFGLTAGAEAVAHAAGTDWDTLSERALYAPLGMTSTSSRYADFVARKDRAILHARVGGTFQPLYTRDPDAQSPAGGVSTNVLDLSTWMAMVLANGQVHGKPLIEQGDLQPAIRPEVITSSADDPRTRAGTYGYGFNVGVQPGGRVTLGHSGAFTSGAGTAFTLLPSADLGIVVLTNGAPVGAAEAVTAEFLDLVQFGHSTRDWLSAYGAALAGVTGPVGDLAGTRPPADAKPPERLSRYTGTYRNGYYGKAVVRNRHGHLEVALGPKGHYRLRLDAWDGSTFSFVPTGENATDGSLSSARFTLRHGRVTSMRLQFFDPDGHGRWRKVR